MTQTPDELAQPVAPATLEVDVGRALPPSPQKLPLLRPAAQGLEAGQGGSTVAQGMRFVGNALLRSACSESGQAEGRGNR